MIHHKYHVTTQPKTTKTNNQKSQSNLSKISFKIITNINNKQMIPKTKNRALKISIKHKKKKN